MKHRLNVTLHIAAWFLTGIGWVLAIGYQSEASRLRGQIVGLHAFVVQSCVLNEETEDECEGRFLRALGK